MHPIVTKTIGGLSSQYYFRQFVFGLGFFVLSFLAVSQSHIPYPVSVPVILFVNTLLYPYARYVYEGVIDFFMGENVFLVNAALWFSVKMMTMSFCWCFAIFIAPVGLIYLYFHHSRAERSQ